MRIGGTPQRPDGANADDLRALQAPFRKRRGAEPAAALATLRAGGDLDAAAIACEVETGPALAAASLHPATGRSRLELCSGGMLLEAPAASGAVTLKS